MRISTIFAASTTEPPPIATTRISFGVLGLPGHVNHHLAGGVLWDAVEGPGMTIAQRLADVLDLFGGGIEGTADNEIDALRA